MLEKDLYPGKYPGKKSQEIGVKNLDEGEI